MAKTKADLLQEATALGLKLDSKLKVSEITKAIADVATKPVATEEKTPPKAPTIAKAGKRSAKALAEQEEQEAKEARKVSQTAEVTEKPKKTEKPPRSRLLRRGKNYRKAAEAIEVGKLYQLAEAIELATKTNPTKFDASVELHIRLGVDPRQADQNVRDMVVLPAGSGKTVRVAVFAEAEKLADAKKAGADVVGADDFLQQLDKGTLDFDILIATPSSMSKLGKYARVLGPKGLMPNPKSGTVATDLVKAVTEAKAGRVEYRVDSTGIIHITTGKVSFGAAKLLQNAEAILNSVKGNKPASLKSAYIQTMYVTTTMGPSIPIAINN